MCAAPLRNGVMMVSLGVDSSIGEVEGSMLLCHAAVEPVGGSEVCEGHGCL